MQVYFEPEQAFSISTPQPVFEISIAYKKKHVIYNPTNQEIQKTRGNTKTISNVMCWGSQGIFPKSCSLTFLMRLTATCW